MAVCQGMHTMTNKLTESEHRDPFVLPCFAGSTKTKPSTTRADKATSYIKF